MSRLAHTGTVIFALFVALVLLVGVGYAMGSSVTVFGTQKGDVVSSPDAIDLPEPPPSRYSETATHVETPEIVRAVYLTAWSAGLSSRQEGIIDFLKRTEANALVIDIKDDTGKVAFFLDDPRLALFNSGLNRVPDIEDFIEKLHGEGVYVIGRIAVFQDPYFVNLHPDFAVHTASGGAVWRDRKGLSWIDPAAKPAWEYVSMLAEYSYQLGFDEINFDYIRYPTDGNMQDIAYPMTGERTRAEVIKEFFTYVDDRLRGQGILISADVFGMTTIALDDLGIGQVFTDILPHVDALAPMIYPSHYPSGYQGILNPAKEPYRVISHAVKGAITKAESIGEPIGKIRPWLQDFNLGATYDATMVRAQMQALYDAGIYSWMMWDPANTYTSGAYLEEGVDSSDM